MKYIKKFNLSESNSEKFDLESAMDIITKQYDEETVLSNLDEEILEWVDDDWEDEYESEYDWYIDHNNGEAQESVINQIINWYKSESNIHLNDDEYSKLFNFIKDKYNLI